MIDNKGTFRCPPLAEVPRGGGGIKLSTPVFVHSYALVQADFLQCYYLSDLSYEVDLSLPLGEPTDQPVLNEVFKTITTR